ncbi:hypothetical protein [Bacillus safensis]|uniref:hypothetical protein n=1 Tax=Bacillus safensis TaxID=561879 RepID=UPI002FFF432A
MAFTKEIPQWENAGQKPPQSKITEGFKPLDHPPADWFNWFMNGTYNAVKELQDGAASTTEVTAALKVITDALTKHSNDKNNPHAVTKSQVGLGNVDNIKQASKDDFDNHVADKMLHTSEAEKDKWNNSQLSKITADNGIPLIYVRDVNESILDKIINNGLGMGTFYAVTNSKDLPPASRTIRGIYHMTDASNGKGTFGWVYATDFANVTYHNYLNNGSWRGWQRVLTDDELSSTWNLVTLINGTAQHNAVYPLKFSIRQNVLHLRGSFENIPPSETVIARFAQKPSGKATFGATTVGSYGSARLSLAEDGSLKYDGMSANDPSKVNRIEINELIPLW